MNLDKKKKRILIIFAVTAIIVITVAIPYIPFNKILRVGTVEESEYINRAEIQSRAPNTLFFDFEVDPAAGNTGGLYKGIAHSGSFSSKVFGKNTYSPAIERKVGDIGTGNLDAVGMSAWVYIFPTGNEVTASYVLSVNNDLGVNICWKSVSVSGKELPMGKWFKISGMFDLAGMELKDNYKIQIYFWNNSNCDILVDDLYIVFGGQKPRRGDSTLVDMTKGAGFSPRFNFPPFPTLFLSREEIGNGNTAYLVNQGDRHEGAISPYDTVLTGNFTGNAQKLDDLLVLKEGNHSEILHFCADRSQFIRIGASFPPEAFDAIRKGKSLPGKFSVTGASQIVMISGEEILLGSFDPVKDLCRSGDAPESSFRILWKISSSSIKVTISGAEILATDADGDGLSEMLVIQKSGSWILLKLNGQAASPVSVIASGNDNDIPEWDQAMAGGSLTAGRFMDHHDREVILSVFQSAGGKGLGFSLRRYDSGSRKFLPVYPERQHYAGKTIGPDTLKPGDRFFVSEQGTKRRILRYNREWRFNLKEIAFNDSTFRVIANLDFKGYELDHNPKYFEMLGILAGNFLKPGNTSLMVTGRNCKMRDEATGRCREFRNLPFLPDMIQFYSYENDNKK